MQLFDIIHKFNILLHVLFGTICILFGLYILIRPKGDNAHKRKGKWFISFAWISIGAAIFGSIMFRGQIDLILISFLVAYLIYSAPRALVLVNNGRNIEDLVPAIIILLFGIFLFAGARFGLPSHWQSPKIIAASFGMMFYGFWDTLRTLFSIDWRSRLNIAEHAFKMVSIVGSTLSVGVATLLKTQEPYVPLGISAAFAFIALGFAAWSIINFDRYSVGVSPSSDLKARLKDDNEL